MPSRSMTDGSGACIKTRADESGGNMRSLGGAAPLKSTRKSE